MKLNAREKKVLVTGAVIVAGILLYYALSSMLPDRENLLRTVELKKKMLLKQRETLSREDYYRTRLDQYKARLDQMMTKLLPGENPNVAGAELQKVLKDFADEAGVEITQMNVLPEKNVQERITRVSVRVDTNCSLDQLVEFLSHIENHEKFLTVDEMMITSFPTQKRFGMRPNLTVSGYISTSENKAAGKP